MYVKRDSHRTAKEVAEVRLEQANADLANERKRVAELEKEGEEAKLGLSKVQAKVALQEEVGLAAQAKLDEAEQKLQQMELSRDEALKSYQELNGQLVNVRGQAESESSQSKEKVADLQRQLEQQSEEKKQLGAKLEDALEKRAADIKQAYAERDSYRNAQEAAEQRASEASARLAEVSKELEQQISHDALESMQRHEEEFVSRKRAETEIAELRQSLADVTVHWQSAQAELDELRPALQSAEEELARSLKQSDAQICELRQNLVDVRLEKEQQVFSYGSI